MPTWCADFNISTLSIGFWLNITNCYSGGIARNMLGSRAGNLNMTKLITAYKFDEIRK